MNINFTSLSGQGKRPYNEDFLLVAENQFFYMVCDGVGGSNRGDIASKKACEYFSAYLLETDKFSTENIEIALQKTEENFDQYIQENPEAKGMATTLTMLKVEENRAIVGHIGDSRVYQIRDGAIIFCTQDHSFVNELVASGFLTPEEAAVHPKKNTITRAIQGTEHNTLIDVELLYDLAIGDYFLLCSDGILESVDDYFIENNFQNGKSVEEIKQSIETICSQNSDDNYTAIIIKIS